MKVLQPGLSGVFVAVLVGLGFGLIGAGLAPSVVAGVTLGAVATFVLAMLSSNSRPAVVPAGLLRNMPTAPSSHDRALLYVMREGFYGKYHGIDVRLDTMLLTQLQAPRFTRTEIGAGSHVLGAVAPSRVAASQYVGVDLPFDALGGETLVYRLTIRLGLMKNTVHFVREPDVARAIARMERYAMVAAEAPVAT